MKGLRLAIMTVLLVASAAMAGPLEDGLADLAKSRSNASSPSGAEAMEALAKSRGEAGKASGHGIDAGIADLDTYRAEQKALAERQERTRLEAEAKNQEETMTRDCKCVLKSCSTSSGLSYIVTRDCSSLMGEKLNQCQKEEREEQEQMKAEKAWKAAHKAEIEEEDRRRSEAKRAQRKVCEDWKAAGPMADTEAFTARLRQQDQAIAEADRVSSENARQRDAMIAADAKRAIAEADRVEADRIADGIKVENDKRAAALAARKAKEEAELAKAAEAEEKLRQWCMADPVRLDNCACGKYTTIHGPTCTK